MRVMWVGIRITEEQFKKLVKKNKGGPIKIVPEAIVGAEFAGRKIEFEDLVGGYITKE
jgi:hypothetical protein